MRKSSWLQLVVLDEADTLLEKGFKGEVEAVLKPLRSKPKPAVCALVVATFTQVSARSSSRLESNTRALAGQ